LSGFSLAGTTSPVSRKQVRSCASDPTWPGADGPGAARASVCSRPACRATSPARGRAAEPPAARPLLTSASQPCTDDVRPGVPAAPGPRRRSRRSHQGKVAEPRGVGRGRPRGDDGLAATGGQPEAGTGPGLA